MATFNLYSALRTGRARTRDGQLVLQLQRATTDTGRPILIGKVFPRLKPCQGFSFPVGGCWESSGKGYSGSDDLTNYKEVRL